MARKLFETIRAASTVAPPSPTAPEQTSDDALPRIRSARSLRGGLMEISANSVRDIDPAVISADGPRDRLDLDETSIEELAKSIRQHGQQVPILVRPADEPDRYRVVYGRRRLEAARRLGVPVKALVRQLDDTASVVAQGQENSLRLNPSFIEKAVFVGALRQSGYESAVIQDALGITRQSLSVLSIVQQAIPLAAIEAIGPAHDIGRRRWLELADLARNAGVDLAGVLARCADQLLKESTSEGRFEIFSRTAVAGPKPPKPSEPAGKPLTGAAGQVLGHMRGTREEKVLAVSARAHPEFSSWFEENAEEILRELHNRWHSTAD